MNTATKKTANDFFRALGNTEPLDYSKPEEKELYVNNLHGDAYSIALLSKEIQWHEGQGVYLYSGQLGSGKSTELLRLRGELKDLGYAVFYSDLAEWLNPQKELELGSFLLAVVASWVDQLGTQGQNTWAGRFWDLLTKTHISITGLSAEIDFGVAKTTLQATLKQDDAVLQSIEDAIKANKTGFIKQIHAFVEDVVASFETGRKVVLLIDSLEKFRGVGQEADRVYDSVLGLFQNTQALVLPTVHVVYSISFLVLEQNTQLPGQLGNAVVCSLPSIHVFENCSTKPDRALDGKLKELLSLRFVDWPQFFTPEQISEVIQKTGGDLRDFMRCLRAALISHDEKLGPQIGAPALNAAFNQIRPTLLIPQEHIQWMAQVEQSHHSSLGGDISAKVLDRYLTTKHILAYRNGGMWFALHPLIRDDILLRAGVLPTKLESKE